MKRGLILSISLAVLGFFMQTSFFPAWGMTRLAPNLLIAAIMPLAFLYGPVAGLSTGFVLGILQDLVTGYGLGLSAVPLCIAGFLAGIVKDYLNNEHFLMSMIGSCIAVILLDFWSIIVLYFSRMEIALTWGSVWRTFLTMLLTAVFAAATHLLVYRRYADGGRNRRSMYLN